MPGLGDLVVNLSADTKKLNAGLDAGKGGLKGFASSAVSFLNPVTAIFTAMTASVVGVGVAVWGLQGRISTLAGVADKAAQTGLSGKFLQQLEYAADQSGVSAETLTGGIKKLTIAIGQGSKSFGELGLNLAELKQLSPEQQFLKVAEAIGKLPTAADRAAAAVKVFGKAGFEMTGLFAGGLNDVNKLLRDAEALGIGVSAEGLAKAAAADDAIQRMKASFSALLDQVAVGVAPVFSLIADYITDWIPPLTKFFAKFNDLDDKVTFIGDLFEAGLSVAFEAIKENWSTMLDGMVDEAIARGKEIAMGLSGINFIKGVIGAGEAVGGKVNDIAGQRGGLAAAKERFAGVLGRLGPDDQGLIRGLNLPGLGGQPQGEAKADGTKLAALAGGIAEAAKGAFAQASLAAQSKFTDMKMQGGYLGSVVKNMFTGKRPDQDTEAVKKIDPQLAGAMQRGSAEAYSTIVQANLRGQDPNVKATEKQTGVLVKAMKANKPQFVLMKAFA